MSCREANPRNRLIAPVLLPLRIAKGHLYRVIDLMNLKQFLQLTGRNNRNSQFFRLGALGSRTRSRN